MQRWTPIRNLMLAAVTALASLGAQSQTLVRFQDYPGTGLLLVRVAQEMGFCEKAGIKCELKTIAAAPLGLQTMLAGDIEVAFGPTEVAASAGSKKAPIKIIGAGFVDPVFFMVAGGQPLQGEGQPYPAVVKGFKGKKIGVTQRGSGAEFQVIDMLQDAGLSAADVTLVAVGAPNTAFPAVSKGQVDLVMSFAPMDGMCEVLKACRVVVDPRKGEGPKSIQATRGGAGVLMVKAAWADSNPAVVASIRNMLQMADAYMHTPANYDKVLGVLRKTFGIALPNADDIAAVVLANGIKTFHAQGNVAAMQAVADSMLENKLLDARVDMSSLVQR